MKEDIEKQVVDQKTEDAQTQEDKKSTAVDTMSANEWVANMPTHHLDEGKYKASFHWCGAKECPVAV